MKNIKNSKLLLKILSGIIAIVLWFAITYTEDPAINQTLTGVKLEITGESTLNSNGFAIINKDDLPSISVVIRGNRSNVISALGEIYASVDVSSIRRAGTNTLPVSYSYPTGRVVLEKIKVGEVSVETEALISRDIPVKAEAVNREKNSGSLVRSVCKSETVTVSGAESSVYKIAYARAKIDTSKISKTSTQEFVYDLCTEKGETVSEDNIVSKSTNTVTVENIVYEKTSLPIKVVLDEESRRDFGIKIKSIEETTVDAGLDEGVEVDFIEAVVTPQSGKNSFDAVLSVPDGVYIPEENLTVSVSGEVLPKQLVEITASIDAVNVPSGQTPVIVPKEKAITLKTVEDIDDIKLKAIVNIGKMTAQEEILPIEIKTDADVEIVGTYSVLVKLENAE